MGTRPAVPGALLATPVAPGALPATPVAPASRATDLVLARLHLRLGSLALARAELETLAGRDGLDEDGLVDLAEARWRTGDIAGAGEAAVAALTDEDGPLLALVVAAEAAGARGRPTESRRLAARAMSAAAGSIDAIFAGMPRGAAWPPDASAPPPAPTTMFDAPRGGSVAHPAHIARPDPPDPYEASTSSEAAESGTIGLWGDDTGAEPAQTPDEDIAAAAEVTGQPDPAIELERGRATLDLDDPGEAALHLGLVLRLSPALAPVVLDLVSDRPEPALVLVRGDACRLVGRELDAQRAFSEVARSTAASVANASEADPPSSPDDLTDPPAGDRP